MKKLAASLASLAALVVPAVASACPSAAEASCCGGTSLGSYVIAVGIGLGIGMGTMAVERKLRK